MNPPTTCALCGRAIVWAEWAPTKRARKGPRAVQVERSQNIRARLVLALAIPGELPRAIRTHGRGPFIVHRCPK